MESIEITDLQNVTVQTDNGRYPLSIYHNGDNDGTESVTVTILNSTAEVTGNITIQATENWGGNVSFTASGTISSDIGFDSDDTLVLTFNDQYFGGWLSGWQGATTYTATCTVGDLLNGTATLSFTRN